MSVAGVAGFELPRGTRTAGNAPTSPKIQLNDAQGADGRQAVETKYGGFPSAPLRVPPYQKRVSLSLIRARPKRRRLMRGKACAAARKEDITDNDIFKASTARLCGRELRAACGALRGRRQETKRQHEGREKSRFFSLWENAGAFRAPCAR